MSIGLSPSDFISIPQFAWSVYKSCRDSTGDYRALSVEVQLLHTVLNEVAQNAKECELSLQSAERLELLGKGCHDVLSKLNTALAGYAALQDKQTTLMAKLRKGKQKIKWVMEKPVDIRTQIMMHISLLTLFNASLAASLSGKPHVKKQVHLAEMAEQVAVMNISHPPRSIVHEETSNVGLGVVQACWGCKALASKCGPGTPCASCTIVEKRFCRLGCRRGPLANLAQDIIPEFFLPEQRLRVLSWCAQKYPSSLPANDSSVILEWEAICFEVPMKAKAEDLNVSIERELGWAISDFQSSFPDRYHFRTHLIEAALSYQRKAQSSVINLGCKFLILSFIISHQPSIYNPNTHTTISCNTITALNVHDYMIIYSKIRVCISALLYTTLQSLLQELQTLIFRRNRQDWPNICFSLSLLFFAAESLQVDIFLHTDNMEKGNDSCDAMQVNGIYILAELFLASTAGFDPLILDWDLEENQQLLDNDEISIKAMRSLQTLSQSYWTFLRERKKIEFTFADTDCLTGKLTAGIFQA